MSFKLHHQIDATTVIPVNAESVTIPAILFHRNLVAMVSALWLSPVCSVIMSPPAAVVEAVQPLQPWVWDGGSGGSGSGSGGSTGGGTTSGQTLRASMRLFRGLSTAVMSLMASVTSWSTSGILHQEVFGDHNEDRTKTLASTSKVPAVMAMLALQEDPEVTFSIDEPVAPHLYDGVYADRTVKQMVSNTSGILVFGS